MRGLASISRTPMETPTLRRVKARGVGCEVCRLKSNPPLPLEVLQYRDSALQPKSVPAAGRRVQFRYRSEVASDLSQTGIMRQRPS